MSIHGRLAAVVPRMSEHFDFESPLGCASRFERTRANRRLTATLSNRQVEAFEEKRRRPLQSELDFILGHDVDAGHVLERRSEVLGQFAAKHVPEPRPIQLAIMKRRVAHLQAERTAVVR